MKKIISGILSLVAVFSFAFVAHAATTVVITGNTSTAENDPGWNFNRDLGNATSIEFTTDEQTIGSGSLYVEPIGTTPAHKFIGELFQIMPISEFNSFSLDYKIAGNGTVANSDDFYVNVYTNRDNTTNYFECRFDYVATNGSTSNFEELVFSSDSTATNVVKRGTWSGTCPTTLAEMPAGSHIRAISVNIGQSNASDVGLAGYLDNVVVNTDSEVTTYDLEATNPAPTQVTGMTVINGTTPVGCGAVINQSNITVDWEDNSETDIDFYQYQADSSMTEPYEFTTSVSDSERTGTIRDLDGTYNYRVRAVDTAGNQGTWSDWCSVTLDRVAPDVEITQPTDNEVISGSVEVKGSVNDLNLLRYYTVVLNSANQIVAGLGTVNTDTSFSDSPLFTWDTTTAPNGVYTIRLEARDKANNKDAGSVDVITATVDNPPTSKDQCKNGGWEDFNNPSFKNQGACVSFVASEGKSLKN